MIGKTKELRMNVRVIKNITFSKKSKKKKLYAGVFSITYFMPKIMALLYRWTEVCFLSDSVYVINLG